MSLANQSLGHSTSHTTTVLISAYIKIHISKIVRQFTVIQKMLSSKSLQVRETEIGQNYDRLARNIFEQLANSESWVRSPI